MGKNPLNNLFLTQFFKYGGKINKKLTVNQTINLEKNQQEIFLAVLIKGRPKFVSKNEGGVEFVAGWGWKNFLLFVVCAS